MISVYRKFATALLLQLSALTATSQTLARELTLGERLTWNSREKTCFADGVGMFKLGLYIDDMTTGYSVHWRIRNLDIINVKLRGSRDNIAFFILEIEGYATSSKNHVDRGPDLLNSSNKFFHIDKYLQESNAMSDFFNREDVQYWQQYTGFKLANSGQQRGHIFIHCSWIASDSTRVSKLSVWAGTKYQPRIESFVNMSGLGVDTNVNGWLGILAERLE